MRDEALYFYIRCFRLQFVSATTNHRQITSSGVAFLKKNIGPSFIMLILETPGRLCWQVKKIKNAPGTCRAWRLAWGRPRA